jgi:hypothetical protein
MAGEYLPFTDMEAAEGAWEQKKNEWLKFLMASYAKQGVKSALASAVNHFTFNVAGVIFEAPALVWTSRHIEQLGEIKTDTQYYPCDCVNLGPGNSLTCGDILEYVIEQKTKKKNRRILGAVPVIGTFESLRAKVHGALKSNRGGDRENRARILHTKARAGCLKSRATVAELMGNYKRQESWEAMFSLCSWDEGWKVLKEKMAST